jgi:hypothetical protein
MGRKKDQLHDDVVPKIAGQVAKELRDRIRKRTPHGVRWVPPGARVAVPVRTSNLIKSIDREKKGMWSFGSYVWKVTTDKEYAPYVEYGTSPHIIRGTPGESLVYYVKGKQDGAAFVKHPGTKAVRMFSRGVADTRASVRGIGSPYLEKWARSK